MKLRIVVFLCRATTANVHWWLWPFCKLPVTTGKSRSYLNLCLVFLPVASPMACAFSSTLPVASKLLNQGMSQCLTRGQMVSLAKPESLALWGYQMASTDLPLHTHTSEFRIMTSNFSIHLCITRWMLDIVGQAWARCMYFSQPREEWGIKSCSVLARWPCTCSGGKWSAGCSLAGNIAQIAMSA